MKHLKLLTIILALSVCSTVSAQKKGDVNVDGYVNISDVVSTINVIAGNETYKLNSDINTDEKTDISDIVAIINIISNTKQEEEPDEAVKAGLCPDNHHPHAIDLGDGVKWACCNVGASAPWEYGGYFAWGEKVEKIHYTEYLYTYFDYKNMKFIDLGSDIASTNYDVAHMKWVGKWHMPSLEQIKLLDNCTTEWATFKGIKGRKYTGSNGNVIFLPAAGYRWEDTYDVGDDGIYWSSTMDPDGTASAFMLLFYSGGTHWGYGYRFEGYSVRPVTE